MTYSKLIIFLMANFVTKGLSHCEDGWLPFGEQKCYKILDAFVTRDAALELCANAVSPPMTTTSSSSPSPSSMTANQNHEFLPISPLLEIKSRAEQVFISEKLFNQSNIFNDVWLGAKWYHDEYDNITETTKCWIQWENGDELVYNNWGEGYPTNTTSFDCIQLTSTTGRHTAKMGEWRDVPCSKRNILTYYRRRNETKEYSSFDLGKGVTVSSMREI